MAISLEIVKQYTKYRYWRLTGLEKKKKHGGTISWEKKMPQKALVLGNGPSLNNIDPFLFKEKGFSIVCVNYFPLKEEHFFELRPGYLCLLDPAFTDRERYNNNENTKALFDRLSKVDWELKIITYMDVVLPIQNSSIKYIYLCEHVATEPYYINRRYELYKKNIASCGFQNVVIGALFYLIANGCKDICVAGIDMSEFKGLFVDENNDIIVEKTHHYGNERCKFEHVGKGEFYRALGLYQKMFEQFFLISEFALDQGAKIRNLSVNSYVDVFEKCDQSQVLQ